MLSHSFRSAAIRGHASADERGDPALKGRGLVVGEERGRRECRRRDVDERLGKIEAYTKAMLTAWEEGKVTATEHLLVGQLKEHLKASEADHKHIESSVMQKVLDEEEAEAKTYRDLLRHAKARGLDARARKFLLEAREVLGIPADEAFEIEDDLGLKI